MTTKPRSLDAEGLLELPRGQLRRELIQGELREMAPAGHEHGRLAAIITASLIQHVLKNRLGAVYAAETGFKLESNPDTVRAPDVAFVAANRLGNLPETGYFPGPPDLAIEIVSPNDRYSEVEEKVEIWLFYGVRMVFTLSPQTRTATVYRSLDNIKMIRDEGNLDGADVIPGWVLPLTEIFGETS